ncbi:hypothetical protein [Pseudomonas amygdali]|uniref:Uncharacterized protein n=2 Tax=Pseudomonas amygdali pv. lachrymans TaxID=53707 RepID=A0ABR5KSC7_PSEAV|nr:hypothetical protein [Pseudomonas amygdali]AXH60125.1 hypothetical protein PLA107_033485 [Pseudomonas amygdali pv. lachrymans str. M301315]KPC17530.1 Uncharacterized protein AC499_0732 [Pseudomonas amygdali pv. lachrymans]RMT06408.1 hypothetical protein ALP54_03970 [Pseudomonas amygdali pv. lachrymans]
MTNPLYVNAQGNYALGLGLNERQQPVCLLLSYDSVTEGGEAAINAQHFLLEGEDLHINGSKGTVVLKEIEQACLDAVNAKLPLVVIDPANEREVLVTLLEDPASDTYRE